MRFKGIQIAILFSLLSVVINYSCQKPKALTVGGTVKFSVDTLKFDTVFTTQGSYTTGLLIYNPQNQDVVLSSVRLQNGNASYFHLNVDGFQGNSIPNLKIAAHDSIYVFATVKINPNDTLTPFIVTDKLIATLNGNDFSIPFTAYGQNAYFIVGDSIGVNTTWKTDKPYVVIHYEVVGPSASLTIPANCKIYMHQDARIFVYGKLQVDTTGVQGKDSVVFQGDRLDRAYFGYVGYPGEWGGIYFISGSYGNISHTILKNGGGSTNSYLGFQTQSAMIEVDSAAFLNINQSVIKNAIGYGILDFQGRVAANNCLVTATGAEAFIMLQGGNATMTNCTFANYGTPALSHSDNKTVTLVNYLPIGNGQYISGTLNASLKNCIVYGSLDSEIICDSAQGATATLIIDHCLLKTGSYFENFVNFVSTLKNSDPMFTDPTNGDFHIKSGSPAIGKGITGISVGSDLDNKTYLGDIGCYQH